MSRLLLRDCAAVVTMDDAGTELRGGSVLVEAGRIAWVGLGAPPAAADGAEILDGRGCVAVPGLINTHHHLFQVLTRARAQDLGLFAWLTELYPVWAGLDAEWVGAAAAAGLAELALSGCSTASDHAYVFPTGADGLLEAEVAAAAAVGVRLHLCRGSMDLGASRAGLPPDSVVEPLERALAETERAVHRFHDPAPGSMLQVAVGPCSPFSASRELLRESVALARGLGVRLHTHLAETADEGAFCRRAYGCGPVELLDQVGLLGPDVWLAHCVHLAAADVRRIAESRTGVAHCPTSNGRLGAGTAPVRALLDAGVAVGLGVDGSASNDGGHLLGEARQALLVARGQGGPGAMSAREALRLATRGGAACLGRDDLGTIEPGRRADLACFPVDGLASAGAEADPVAAVVLGWPQRVRHLLVEGRWVVRGGRLIADEEAIAARAHRRARTLVPAGAPVR